MTKNVKVALAAVAVVVLVLALVLFPFGKGNATNTEACVPTPETTATVVVTPAVPGTPGTPEIPAVPATPDSWTNLVWHNYTGNDEDYPADGPGPALDDPNWHAVPADPNSEVHSVPPRVPGVPYNVSNNENGHGSWFLWTGTFVPGTPGSDAVPAVPGTPEIPAVTQTVVTPAVVCDTPSETPTVTPVTPEPEDETPVSNPEPPKPPKDVQVTQCVDGVFVTTVNGEVVSESGSCDESTSVAETPVEAQEEGL